MVKTNFNIYSGKKQYMESVKNRVLAIQKNGYDIDFGRVFENAFENYKKIALIAGITILLFSIVILLIGFSSIVLYRGFGNLTDTIANLKLQNFTIIPILIFVTIISIISGLLSPITAGILKMAHCASKNNEFSVGTVFDYYGNSHFKDLFLATFCISIWTTSISLLLDYFNIQYLGLFITYGISFFSFLTIPFIIFGNFNAFDAIKASFIVVYNQFFILLGLLIVSTLMVCMGLIGFCIGIFFTLPFIYSMYYSIYIDSIGIKDEIIT